MTQPFDEFLESVTSATYDEYRGLPGSEVESPAAFAQMRTYLLDLYDGVEVKASHAETDGQVIDCIPRDRHPAARHARDDTVPSPPPRVERAAAGPPHFVSPPAQERPAVAPREYPRGTIPMYRTTLAQLTRFANLAAFSAKDQVAVESPTAGALNKRYATGEQDVACLGGSSHVNVWRPFVTPTFQASFSQQWHLAGQDGTLLQTVECGWHIDAARYGGNIDPHLFVYTTRHNYDTGHSFFNQDGGVYRPLTNPLVLPGAPLQFSQTDGPQLEYRMGFYLNAGAWFFYFQDQPVGFYPLDWFQGGPLTQGATRIKFGGEVGSGLPLWPAMGSGAHASAGFRKAAYQRDALVFPSSGGAQHAGLAEAGSTSGSCYTIGITNGSASEWGTYLFFGGPGGQAC